MQNDPITNAIYDGIKRGITVCLENHCFGSAVILIYSGIDAMTFLSLPAGRDRVKGPDFVDWCEKYIRFDGPNQITGLELYSSRCAMVHTFGAVSDLTRVGRCRMIAFHDVNHQAVLANPAVSNDLVIVSIAHLAAAFFDGIDRFIVDLFKDPQLIPLAEERLRQLMVCHPIIELTEDAAAAENN